MSLRFGWLSRVVSDGMKVPLDTADQCLSDNNKVVSHFLDGKGACFLFYTALSASAGEELKQQHQQQQQEEAKQKRREDNGEALGSSSSSVSVSSSLAGKSQGVDLELRIALNALPDDAQHARAMYFLKKDSARIKNPTSD